MQSIDSTIQTLEKDYFVRDLLQFDTLTPAKIKSFAASPIDTAKAETCCDTFEKDRLCSVSTDTAKPETRCNTFDKKSFYRFPHRHCKARGKPETRDETC